MRWLLTALTVASVACLSAAAFAQAPTIVVIPGMTDGVDPQVAADLSEESAWIVQDHGGYEVFRWYQLEELADPATATAVLDCYGDPRCIGNALYGGGWDEALIVDIAPDGPGLIVEYTRIDVVVGEVANGASARLVATDDFGALVQPCFDALAARQMAPPQPQAPLQVVVTDAPQPPGMIAPAANTSQRRELGSMGRAGRWTAISGGVLTAGGLLFGFAADDTQQEIQSSPHSRSELDDLQSSGRTQQTLANVSYVVGGLAIATGVTLVILDRGNESDGISRIEVTPAGRGARVGVRF